MKRTHVFVAIACLLVATPAVGSVYVGAHPDDIELFMGRNAADDVSSGARVVFILLTAGDAGYGTGVGANAYGIPYYRARLDAHEKAVRFWASLKGLRPPQSTKSVGPILGHQVERVDIGPMVTLYNLNLPDGGGINPDAQSLRKLMSGEIATITSVDGGASYTQVELGAVIRNIIAVTHAGVFATWVNFQDEDATINPGDHEDHLAAGALVAYALAGDSGFSCVNKARFTGYSTQDLPLNLSPADQVGHSATWGVINGALVDEGNPTTWDSTHLAWLGKQYYRQEIGTGTCSYNH